ncbi:MAG: hypothetical protein H6810_05080 [Phycisphaeraceae bacterium]|nr:MAG: hypothetical protein H6810_05080 [Phycisphaeraceae bacterium]
MLSRKLFLAITAVGLVLAPAAAQVAPPPPPPKSPEPEFVPPPIPTPAPAPKREFKAQKTPAKVQQDLPDIPHPDLWEFCGTEDPEVDAVCEFDDNIHYVALRPNPTISPGLVPAIQSVIVARRARFEEMVIEHLDVAMQVDAGLIDDVSITDPEALSELLEMIKPLTPPTNLTQELENRGIITKTMAKFNTQIIADYQRAYGRYLRRAFPEDATNRFMRSMFRDSLIEAMQAYTGLLHESRLHVDEIVDKIDGIPADAAQALKALKIDKIEADPDAMHASAEAVKLAWRPLSLEQKRQYLALVRTFRANEAVPPVPVIDVMWAGKRVVEGVGATPAGAVSTEKIRESREQRRLQNQEKKKDGGDD